MTNVLKEKAKNRNAEYDAGLWVSFEEALLSVIQKYPRGDHLREGEEIERALHDGECPWHDDGDAPDSADSELSSSDDDDDGNGGHGHPVPVKDADKPQAPGSASGQSLSPAPSVGTDRVGRETAVLDAKSNYEAILKLCDNPGSGIDRGTRVFIANKLHSTTRALHDLAMTPKGIDALVMFKDKADSIHTKVLEVRAKTRKEVKKKKNKQAKKRKKEKSKKKKKEHATPVAGQQDLWVLNQLLPCSDPVKQAVHTQNAKLSQRIAKAPPQMPGDDPPLPPPSAAPPAHLVAAAAALLKCSRSSAGSKTKKGPRSVIPAPSVAKALPDRSWSHRAERRARSGQLKNWTQEQLGQGMKGRGTSEMKLARLELLWRLRLRGEALGGLFPPQLHLRWPSFIESLEKAKLKSFGHAVGGVLELLSSRLLFALGKDKMAVVKWATEEMKSMQSKSFLL